MINKDSFNNINLDIYRNISNIDHSEFHQEPGQQHYKLLAYLSTLVNNSNIIDIGTHKGASSTALSYNPSNTIYTFDIENRISDDFNSPKSIKNIVFNYSNIFLHDVRESWKEKILSAPIIFLDIDPHDGILEYEFYLWLKEHKYQGILILDDIWYFKNMRNNFWYKIDTEYKSDITHLGHWSGTGVVQFNKKYDFIILKNTINPTNPTLVTAYYDLTKLEDASKDIMARPKEHYLDSSYSTLMLDYDMVIFCEEESLERIKSIRPEVMHNKTKFMVTKFDDFTVHEHDFVYYRNKIKDNRIKKPYAFDNRNTPSYYLFCIARYIMMSRVIKENPFNSEHFVWINICIERMGYKNLIHLDEVLTNIRDKFSTCYIDYVSDKLISDLDEYYKFGRCSMCSGFFTGNKEYFSEFCLKILEKFSDFCNKGYGHADEQLYSAVYFENPGMFEHYYGDYFQMITNYKYIYDNPDITLNLLIPKSFSDEKNDICYKACKFLIESYKKGTIRLNNIQIKNLMNYYTKSIFNKEELNIDEIKNVHEILKNQKINL